MTSYRDSLKILTENNSSLQVELGDNAKYEIKGVGTTSFQLESGNSLHMKDVLFVPRLRKNLLSISILDDKGYRVSFVDEQFLVWPKDSNIDRT
jgi:hypothetical protein